MDILHLHIHRCLHLSHIRQFIVTLFLENLTVYSNVTCLSLCQIVQPFIVNYNIPVVQNYLLLKNYSSTRMAMF